MLAGAALITASSSPDPAVRECQVEMIGLQDGVFAAAMGEIDSARKAQSTAEAARASAEQRAAAATLQAEIASAADPVRQRRRSVSAWARRDTSRRSPPPRR